MNINLDSAILIGPPCSGKSSILNHLEYCLNWKCFDTGIIYRTNYHEHYSIKKWNDFVTFIDNEIINFIERNAKLSNNIGIIYPKTIKGFEFVEELLHFYGYRNTIVFVIKVDKDILIERSRFRKREDDKRIVERINKFFQNPLEKYIIINKKSNFKVMEIENSYNFDDTFKIIMSTIEEETINKYLFYLKYQNNKKIFDEENNNKNNLHNGEFNIETNILFIKIINKQHQYYFINEKNKICKVMIKNLKFNMKSIKNGILIFTGKLSCKNNVYIISDLLYFSKDEKKCDLSSSLEKRFELIQKYFFNEKKLNNIHQIEKNIFFCFVKNI